LLLVPLPCIRSRAVRNVFLFVSECIFCNDIRPQYRVHVWQRRYNTNNNNYNRSYRISGGLCCFDIINALIVLRYVDCRALYCDKFFGKRTSQRRRYTSSGKKKMPANIIRMMCCLFLYNARNFVLSSKTKYNIYI